MVWQDNRTSVNDYNIYAQNLSSNSTLLWGTDGIAICSAITTQQNPKIVSDGSSGAIITWQDYRSGIDDIYIQRVNSTGSTLWSLDGATVCNAANAQITPQLTSNGGQGAIVVWDDSRGTSNDIYIQSVDLNGATPVELWMFEADMDIRKLN